MPMVFPTSPTVGQVFSSGGRSWVWTGSTWDSPRSDNLQNLPSLVGGNTFTGNQVFNSGRMQVSAQPGFMCFGNANITSGVIIYGSAPSYNQGNHYNNATGLFTAPVAGQYFFAATFWSPINLAGAMGFRVNGGGFFAVAGRDGTDNYWNASTLSSVVYLNANDTMGCYHYSGTVHMNGALNTFSGRLLG